MAYIYFPRVQWPDFRTISRFRKDNEWLQETLAQIVRLCRKLGVIWIGRITIDRTKIKANESSRKTKEVRELDEY